LQFLHALPAGTTTFLVMKRHCKLEIGEALADYFVRLNQHFIAATLVLELDEASGLLRVVAGHIGESRSSRCSDVPFHVPSPSEIAAKV